MQDNGKIEIPPPSDPSFRNDSPKPVIIGIDSPSLIETRERKRESTRTTLAYILTFVVSLLAFGYSVAAFVWPEQTQIIQDMAQIFFTPIITLLAGVLGYYFGQQSG